MEDLLLYFFKETPGVINTYYKFRPVLINALLLVTISSAILANTDKVRSLSLGVAIGIVLVNIGESISRLRGNESKKLRAGSESVNG